MSNEELCCIYQQAIEQYGVEAQTKMAIKEMAELTNALMKLSRGRAFNADVVEEIADVTIMMNQLAFIFGKKLVLHQLELKTKRLKKRLDADKKQ